MTLAARVQFTGQTDCRRDGCGPLGLILRGHTADHPHELVHLAFSAGAPQDLPRFLDAPCVEPMGGGDYRITSGELSWVVRAGAAHLHRDVTREFFRAVPARPIRWSERLFWWIVLGLAASSAGRWVLRTVIRK